MTRMICTDVLQYQVPGTQFSQLIRSESTREEKARDSRPFSRKFHAINAGTVVRIRTWWGGGSLLYVYMWPRSWVTSLTAAGRRICESACYVRRNVPAYIYLYLGSVRTGIECWIPTLPMGIYLPLPACEYDTTTGTFVGILRRTTYIVECAKYCNYGFTAVLRYLGRVCFAFLVYELRVRVPWCGTWYIFVVVDVFVLDLVEGMKRRTQQPYVYILCIHRLIVVLFCYFDWIVVLFL